MTEFLENILNKMSSAFNDSAAINLNLNKLENMNEDKTLKWRGLHNNQYARRKKVKKTDSVSSVQTKNSSGSGEKVTATLPTSNETVENETEDRSTDKKETSTGKQDNSNVRDTVQSPDGQSNPTVRRLRRNRSDIEAPTAADDKPPPIKRRGRTKKRLLTNQPEADSSFNNDTTKDKQSETPLGRPALRRSDRNTISHEKSSPGIKMTIEDQSNANFDSKIEIPSVGHDISDASSSDKGKKVRRSGRLDTNGEVPSKKEKAHEAIIEPKLEETADSVYNQILPEENRKSDTNNSESKQIQNEKTPKKRGRRPKEKKEEKGHETQANNETNSNMKKIPRPPKEATNSILNTTNRKEKPVEIPSTSSQRPLRRIKPTVKILENEELRYEFEVKNIARMAVSSESSVEQQSVNRPKVDGQEPPPETVVQSTSTVAVKKKLFTTDRNNLNVDNIYPTPPQKPCPDPKMFLNEIKAAKINLHKSPEDKKLNRKQQRKLLRQKEKHLEKLGLRKNSRNDYSGTSSTSSDNEEFLPSKKISVGKPNVTLRIRYSKENETNLDGAKSTSKRGHRIRSNQRLLKTKLPQIPLEDEVNVAQVADLVVIKKEFPSLICLCQTASQYYTRKTPETSYCSAIDSIEDQKVGCSNSLSHELLNLLRPSQRVGYMILCGDHKKRLFAHNCCAVCGVFCTQGKFILCQQKHFFHPECAQKFILNSPYDPSNQTNYTSPTLVLKCPHCGCDTPEKTSLVTMRCKTLPVFLPSQRAPIKPAKMSVPECRPILDARIDKPHRSLMELEKLIPESVMNIMSRIGQVSRSEFTTKDLFYSINNDDLERVAEIIASGFNLRIEMPEFLNGTCLHLVAHFGTIQMAYLLLSRDSSRDFLDTIDKEMRTATMCAVIAEKFDILQLFIECGADLSIKGLDGMTCLHIAAKLGNFTIAQLIIEKYKECSNITNFEKFVNTPDDGGWTAMAWAAENGHTDIVSFLINHGADPNICDTENNSVIHWAALSNHVETLLVLLEAKVNCSIQNISGDTPLHIACRQSSTRICLILIANGADLMVKNKAQQLPYDCIRDEESPCARAVGFNMQMRSIGPTGLANRVVCSDISNGREEYPIQVIRSNVSDHCSDDFDDILLPDFKYITKSILLQNSIQIDYRVSQMRICSCNDGCSSEHCQCSTISVQNWYTPEGRLNGEFNYEDPAMIFECNDVCGCNKLVCKNRVVQNGIKLPMQVFECVQRVKGWGVRALSQVPRGSFVAEYTGEILTDLEADRRTDDSYFFDLGASQHCIDANYYGNVSRFFNHSCVPNIVPVRVYFDHQDYRFPKIAFFACKDIAVGDEIAFDYGDKFWAVKQKYFSCQCQSTFCRYSSLRSSVASSNISNST